MTLPVCRKNSFGDTSRLISLIPRKDPPSRFERIGLSMQPFSSSSAYSLPQVVAPTERIAPAPCFATSARRLFCTAYMMPIMLLYTAFRIVTGS